MPADVHLPRLGRSVSPPLEALPERVLQFGTGALLRGLPDAFIDDANRVGFDAGRVVMVGSTGSGRTQVLGDQDGLYTLCIRGLREGERVDETRVIGSVSRAVAASDDWPAVLDLARSPDLALIVSNTTIGRDGLSGKGPAQETGGLSGKPLFRKSTIMLARARKLAGPDLPIIGVGGIMDAASAQAALSAGATLIQLYSGLIYRGPALVREILRALEAADAAGR